jgi:hypothetical protein
LARPNYQGERRRKDLAKKAKKEEKRLRKLEAKESGVTEDDHAAEPASGGEEMTNDKE